MHRQDCGVGKENQVCTNSRFRLQSSDCQGYFDVTKSHFLLGDMALLMYLSFFPCPAAAEGVGPDQAFWLGIFVCDSQSTPMLPACEQTKRVHRISLTKKKGGVS